MPSSLQGIQNQKNQGVWKIKPVCPQRAGTGYPTHEGEPSQFHIAVRSVAMWFEATVPKASVPTWLIQPQAPKNDV